VARESTGRHAFLVAAGILLSRLSGLIRQRVFLHYFGTSDAADAFNAAVRVPNVLQNLFGEGVLSASLIPVYSRLLAEKRDADADRVAGAIGAIIALGSSVFVLAGIAAAPYLLWAITPGYEGEKRELTLLLVRILFPGAGLLVCSAWCLGVLNSHRKFFLSYTAPIVWNAAMIATILIYRGNDLDSLAIKLAWGTVVGSLLQFVVQLPAVLRLVHFRRPDGVWPQIREVIRNFVPVSLSRGVMQISGYIDQAIASFLPSGALTAMTTAQSIYMLPVSLFGMSVSAAELPALSSVTTGSAELQERLNNGLRHIAFFIVPSAMAFFTLGDVVTGVLYMSGRFTRADTNYVWAIIAGSGIGLLASTLGRLYQSTYYAMRDTRTPLRFAIVRVILTAMLGVASALPLPLALGIDPKWGAAGLTASAGVAGWIEFTLLRRTLNARIGNTGLPMAFTAKLWASAALGALAAWGVRIAIGRQNPYVQAVPVLGIYGVTYFAAAFLFGIGESATLFRRLLRRR
jgi:putative peptidoglycan lipid II flippase